MGHREVTANLKALLKQELVELEPKKHRDLIQERESDRASIILLAAMVERFLVRALNDKMPTINSDERDRLFNFEGPCGSFSNRIRMAQALGIIDRSLRRKLDLVRDMRNVAAHAHPDITFDTPQIREATIALLDEKYRDVAEGLSARELRRALVTYSAKLVFGIKGENATGVDEYFEALRKKAAVKQISAPDPTKRLARGRRRGKRKPR